MTSNRDFATRLAERRARQADQAQRVLASHGEFRCGSDCLRGGLPRIAIHTEFGPPGQSKDENQDFVVAWRAADRRCPLQWMVAVADGVTSSFRAEWGAEAACWKSTEALLVHADLSPRAQATRAMQSAADSLFDLAKLFHEHFEESRPAGDHVATWKFTLDEGLLLQTTLVLAWGVRDRAFLAAVGDGGAMHVQGGRLQRLMTSDVTTSLVTCLGPANPFGGFDVWHDRQFGTDDALAVFTDGIDRGLSSERNFIGRSLQQPPSDRGNPAEDWVKELLTASPADHQDNLTLAVVDNRRG